MAAIVLLRSATALRAAIKASGKSQVHLASQVGISQQRLSQLAAGKGPTVPVGTAYRLERALGVRLASLFQVPDAELMKAYLDGQVDDPPPTSDSDTHPSTGE